jgi:DNA-3-methyladenine glycosylase I
VTTVPGEAVPGPDGALRCPWATGTADYLDYHDREWGRPIRTDNGLFERLTLEAFQSGLSWLTILRKRDAFRTAFAQFDIAAVAAFGDRDRARLLSDAAIVRNRAKIDAAIANAKAALTLGEGLTSLVWSFAPESAKAPTTSADIPARTAESSALSVALKRRGFVFVGPVTGYALMQAAGLVNDHLADCCVRDGVVTP